MFENLSREENDALYSQISRGGDLLRKISGMLIDLGACEASLKISDWHGELVELLVDLNRVQGINPAKLGCPHSTFDQAGDCTACGLNVVPDLAMVQADPGADFPSVPDLAADLRSSLAAHTEAAPAGCASCGHQRGAHFREGCDADLKSGCPCRSYSAPVSMGDAETVWTDGTVGPKPNYLASSDAPTSLADALKSSLAEHTQAACDTITRAAQ